MGAMCEQSSCYKSHLRSKLREQANERGIMFPGQIEECVAYQFGSGDTVDEEKAKEIVQACVD